MRDKIENAMLTLEALDRGEARKMRGKLKRKMLARSYFRIPLIIRTLVVHITIWTPYLLLRQPNWGLHEFLAAMIRIYLMEWLFYAMVGLFVVDHKETHRMNHRDITIPR